MPRKRPPPLALTRRQALASASAAFTFTVVPRHVLGDKEATAPSNKLNIACIGTGGMGGTHVREAATQNLVALCDVDETRIPGKKHPQARTFQDYRKMFDAMAKSIDAVYVATPDHHHAFATMAAIQLGKHVYCQKPMTHSVYEARRVAEAARAAKVATQMGNQGMSGEDTRVLCELIGAGAIGHVREVHIWTDRPVKWWPQGVPRPADTPPVPANLDWDTWIGPAPMRPYNPAYHPFKWRGWWDFGTGALGDIALHAIPPVAWALKLGRPVAIEAEHSGHNGDSFPAWSIIRFEYPQRGDLPPVKLVWYDGGKKPPRPEELDPSRGELPGNGRILVGDKGKIYGTRLIPEAKMKELKPPPKTLPRVPSHYEDWFTACKGGRPACSNFDFIGPIAEGVMAGNIALKLGKRIEWDGEAMKARNCPEADALVKREYRKGWTL